MNAPSYNEPIALSRDVDAVLIPDGTPVTLEAETVVFVIQALGGSVTVNVNGNLARVAGSDLDALGMEKISSPVEGAEAASDGSVDTELVWQQLKTCYDPEIPIDIVELGLIYNCTVNAVPGGNRVEIAMTLTAPGCGMGPILVDDVQRKVSEVPNVTDVHVDLTFDPPWNPEMMSEAARLQTGMY